MYGYERGWSLSFVGCGFLGFYHLGATCCLNDRAPHLLRDARMFFGSSAGALHCATFLAGVPPDQALQALIDVVQHVRSRNIGILHPSFNMGRFIREKLHRILPANVHKLISGKVCISLTRVSDRQNVLVSDFQSKDEVVDALLCSSFIPFFFGLIPPSFRGVRYIDGGLSDSVPFLDAKTTITVSPFYGEYDICPKVKSTNFLHVDVNKLNLRLCLQNLHLLCQVLFPPDVKGLEELFLQGYLDAIRFLEEKGICDRPHPCLSLSSGEPEVLAFPQETTSLEASPGVAAWQARPEGDMLLDDLPCDESILLPKFSTVLKEPFKSQDGYMSKIYNFLPVKIMSYVMLPCTLPVESAIAVVLKLLMRLPDIPEDIQWLQSTTSQLFSRVTTHLFPTSRLAKS